MHLTVLLVATRFLGRNVVNVVNVNVSQTILDVAGTMEVHLHGEDPPKVRIKAPLEPKGEVTMAKVRTLRGQERPVHRKAAQKGKVSGNKSESNLFEKKTRRVNIILLELLLFGRKRRILVGTSKTERYETCGSQKRNWNRFFPVKHTRVPCFCGRLKSSLL